MGRKRKVDSQEDKSNNETTVSKEKTDYSMAMDVKKGSKALDVAVRRSGRISSSRLLSGNLPSLEHVNLAENEQQEEEAPNSPQVNSSPLMKEKDSQGEPLATTLHLEEKVDYLVRTADEFKSKFVRQASARTDEAPSDFSYKSLYFDSQKKLEALMAEHYDLVRKLEFARGKIEAYESMKDQKEVILVSGLSKAAAATEAIATANNSSQPGPTCVSPPPSLPAATIPDVSNISNPKTYNRKNQGKRR